MRYAAIVGFQIMPTALAKEAFVKSAPDGLHP